MCSHHWFHVCRTSKHALRNLHLDMKAFPVTVSRHVRFCRPRENGTEPKSEGPRGSYPRTSSTFICRGKSHRKPKRRRKTFFFFVCLNDSYLAKVLESAHSHSMAAEHHISQSEMRRLILRLRQGSSFEYSEHIPLNKSMNVHSAGVLTLYTCATCVISCFLQLVPGGLQPQQRPGEADVAAHRGLPHTGQQDCRPGWLLHLCQVQCVTIYCPINSFYRTVTNRRRDRPLRLMSCVHISNKNQMITSK